MLVGRYVLRYTLVGLGRSVGNSVGGDEGDESGDVGGVGGVGGAGVGDGWAG